MNEKKTKKIRRDYAPATELAEVKRFIEAEFFPKKTFSMDQIYSAKPDPAAYPVIREGVPDHTMYVACSDFVRAGILQGRDPYEVAVDGLGFVDEEDSWDHKTAIYTVK